MSKIGIFAGSFNPPHLGHRGLIKYFIDNGILDSAEVLVTPKSPAKSGKVLVPVENRLDMMNMIFKDIPNLIIDQDYSPGPPYWTINLLELARHKYPKDEVYYVIGMDNLVKMHTWKAWDKLIKNNKIMVYQRPGYEVPSWTNANVTILPDTVPVLDISSTMIRENILDGKDIVSLVGEDVADYIKTKGLFSSN